MRKGVELEHGTHKPLTAWKPSEKEKLRKKLVEYIEKIISEQ
jgi:hypothetical protein